MIILEMGYIDAQGTMGITLEQWFMLSFFIIICSIIVLVLPVVGTLMSETPSAQGTRRGGGADRNRGVIIEAVPERDEDELEEVEAKELRAKADSGTEAEAKFEEVSVAETEASADDTAATAEKVKKAKAEPVGKGDLSRDIIVYPTKVGSGLYGDTYIKVSTDQLLKLRTILFDEKYLY
jgi:hypothetical protein